MKKLITTILSLLLCTGILFCVAGCESKSSSSSNSNSKSEENASSDIESKKEEKKEIENPAINQTVLYDENNIKIIAEKIETHDTVSFLTVSCINNTKEIYRFSDGRTDGNLDGIRVTYNYADGTKENYDIDGTHDTVYPNGKGELRFYVDDEKLKKSESVSLGIVYSPKEKRDETYLYPLTVDIIDKSEVTQNNNQDENKEYTVIESDSFKSIDWPESELGKHLPKPDKIVFTGRINSDKSDLLSLDIIMYEYEFKDYVEQCKEEGFTKNYDNGEDHYYAENDEGYKLSLDYHEMDSADEPHPLVNTLCIEFKKV